MYKLTTSMQYIATWRIERICFVKDCRFVLRVSFLYSFLCISAFVNTAPTKAPVTKSAVGNIVVRRLNIQDNKAVIPLAIGLVLALLLLLGVIFRLKTSRRRRTKAFLTDDADYLINGMYL